MRVNLAGLLPKKPTAGRDLPRGTARNGFGLLESPTL